jgi:hypothetical protein
MIVTVFRHISDVNTPFYRSIDEVLARIKEGHSEELITQIRNEDNKEKRQELKKGLPSICFSGKFTKRSDSACEAHSGFICLDFDNYDSIDLVKMKKSVLKKDPYVYSVFISPSGMGLKVLVKIPDSIEDHLSYFNALQNYFDDKKHFDTTSKNLSRVCYESYDPDIYINEDSEVWHVEDAPDPVQHSITSDTVTIPLTDERDIVKRLVKWWEKRYPMVEGQRNNNAFTLAMAFNEFGVSKSTALIVLGSYAQKGFSEREIDQLVNSAYSKTDLFGTKYFEDEKKIKAVDQAIKQGKTKKEIHRELESEGVDGDLVEKVIRDREKKNESPVFWKISKNGAVSIIPLAFKVFLEERGFWKYYPEDGQAYIYVRITNNLVEDATEQHIKDFVLDYLLNMEDQHVYNYFAEKTKYFKDDFLSLLSPIDIEFVEDTDEYSYLYYRNCAVRVNKDGVEMIDYIDLGRYVWSNQVIDRDFEVRENYENNYRKFLHNISGNKKARIDAMESTIGFLLSGFKNPSYCPATILNDEVISETPEGGTGKGLYVKALSHMRKVVSIDGKMFAFDKSFPYQLVSKDTQIICFDDVQKNFSFERLFSLITEGITLEKKNKDAIKIPFERSPKIIVTTNYALKGAGNSFERRKWELELHHYYSKDFTPEDEFGGRLFGSWDDEEWLRFDNYMIACLRKFLNHGLIKSEFVNLGIRKLSSETTHEFIEFCGLTEGSDRYPHFYAGNKMYKKDVYDDFISEYPDFAPKAKRAIAQGTFYKWLKLYWIFKEGVEPEDGRDSIGRWIHFQKKPDPPQTKMAL